MSRCEWGVSLLIAVFVAFKVAETVLQLENWPASNVSMFSAPRPRQFVPLRPRLLVTRDSLPLQLTHWDFALSKDEFASRLFPDRGVAERCGKLVASYNRAVTDPRQRVENAIVEVEPVARPGLWNDVKGWKVACILPADTPGNPGERR